MKDMRIVFMGTPEFAVTILNKLVENQANIVAVITSPDKPAGRGLKMNESAVKQYAVSKQLPVLQPTNLKDEQFLAELKNLHADLFVVVAFRMLPEVVWSMPPKGTINLHASILPHYRGAAPINWAVINGEKETGVTTFFIEKEIDTGKIIERTTTAIGDNETVGELHDRLMALGAETTLSTVQKIAKGDVQGIPQIEFIEGELKIAPKIFKDDCKVNFNQSAKKVQDFIRGLSPYPAAWCTLINGGEQRTFKLFASQLTTEKTNQSKQILSSKDGILFPCNNYYVLVTELQPEGKRRMDFKAYLAGNSLEGFTV
ncbi:MAG: methionyl-tRNA formyltransferase [Crocinitomicaceae bacterium]